MHNELHIREASENDIPAMVELFSICLRDEGGTPSEEFWRWKHLDNPFGMSPVLLSFNKQRLVGLRAFMQWQWRQSGNMLFSYRAVDTATHPDFQGHGIFRTLTTQLWDKIQAEAPGSFVYNTPNEKSGPGYLKMGWQLLGKPYADFRFVPGLGLKRKMYWQRAVELLVDLDFSSISARNAEYSSFLIRTNASEAYYKWRYQLVPDRQYGYWETETDNGLVAFVFYLRSRKAFTELRICDEIVMDCKGNVARLVDEGWSKLADRFAGCLVTRLCHLPGRGSKILQPFMPVVTLRLPDDKSGLPAGISDIKSWGFEMGALELF